MRQSAQGNSNQANLTLRIAMLAKQCKKNRKSVGVELNRITQSLRSRISIEACVANSDRQRARRKPGLAQPLAGFLRKMAQHRFHRGYVAGVFGKSMILRN